ncbi:MAG: hypothetical protein ABIF40_04300 [archaeon]
MKKMVKDSISHEALLNELIKQNIELQHKMTDLVIDVKDLTKEIKSMVGLFKEAGEHIKSRKYEDPLMSKLNELLDQNKNVANGLLLLEKFVRQKSITETPMTPRFEKSPF